MTTPTVTQITDFAGETLPGKDAEILAEAFSGVNQNAWQEDAEIIATALLNGAFPDIPITTEPWRTIAEAAEGKSGTQLEDAVYDALNAQYDGVLRMAIYSYLSLKIQKVAARYQAMKLGAQPSPQKQKRLTSKLLESPDPKLKRAIENELIPDKRPAVIRLGNVEILLVDWLTCNGKFVKSEENTYYLHHAEHRLYDMDTECWEAFLHILTGVNPASSAFGIVKSAADTAAERNAETVPVVKFAHYDRDNRILRISRFDGTVYTLNGDEIRTETNGEGPALFYDFPLWQPFQPDPIDHDFLEEISQLPYWKDDAALYSWIFQVWVLSLFFTELCPTRPIMVFLGEKGSGKSMALRLLMKLLFGPYNDISGVPEKPDALTVAAHYYHLYIMDNMDTLDPWMRDKLARISTGATDEYRKLFTSKEMGVIRYRTWLAITARTPDTLRRDDLADRVVILPMKRIPDDQRGRELAFMEWVERNRNGFWFDIMNKLNRIVAELQNGAIPQASPLRMADWEAFGRLVSEIYGKSDLWDRAVDIIKNEQRGFLAEGEVIIEAIEAWLDNPQNIGRWVTARELYNEAQYIIWGTNKPDTDWPRSVKSFGHRLKNVKDYLKERFDMETWEYGGRTMMKYRFNHV
ncbi:MAG: hypothetical protein KatS3mg047_1066 [Bellilinea sp.]|nr:MAG: hypothetical protein KatS3mg047_1066 [Bellilinea sp.]